MCEHAAGAAGAVPHLAPHTDCTASTQACVQELAASGQVSPHTLLISPTQMLSQEPDELQQKESTAQMEATHELQLLFSSPPVVQGSCVHVLLAEVQQLGLVAQMEVTQGSQVSVSGRPVEHLLCSQEELVEGSMQY